MVQTIKKILTNLSLLSLLALPVLTPVSVHAQANIQGELCSGANLTTAGGDCSRTGETNTTINTLLTNIINIFSFVVGIVAVIMIIVGGMKYIMSSGDSGNITGAKNTILYAIIGLVIVAFAQFIVRFVLARVSNT